MRFPLRLSPQSAVMEATIKLWSIRIKMFFILGLLLGAGTLGAESFATEEVRITKLEVPPHVERYDNVNLSCEHNLKPDRLYSVQWHFNGKQLYRYSTDEVPPKMAFNESKLVVDLEKSSETQVALVNVDLTASGLYRCIVTAEGPAFVKASSENNMTVVVIPNAKPLIEPPPTEGLRPGSTVNLNCTVPPSKPAASLEWHVNDNQIPEENLIRYPPEKQSNGLFASRLGVRFKLRKQHFINGELKLKCIAKIATLYVKSEEHSHQTPNHQYVEHSEGVSQLSKGARTKSNGWTMVFCVVQVLLMICGLANTR